MDVDFGRRVCNENRREATLLVKKDKKKWAMDTCGIKFGRR